MYIIIYRCLHVPKKKHIKKIKLVKTTFFLCLPSRFLPVRPMRWTTRIDELVASKFTIRSTSLRIYNMNKIQKKKNTLRRFRGPQLSDFRTTFFLLLPLFYFLISFSACLSLSFYPMSKPSSPIDLKKKTIIIKRSALIWFLNSHQPPFPFFPLSLPVRTLSTRRFQFQILLPERNRVKEEEGQKVAHKCFDVLLFVRACMLCVTRS